MVISFHILYVLQQTLKYKDLMKGILMFNKLKLMVKALILKAVSRILVDDLYMAYHGNDFYFVLWELDQYLRDQIKYNPDKRKTKELDALEDTRCRLYDLMEDNGVDFNHVE